MKQTKEIYRRLKEIDATEKGEVQKEQTEATLEAFYNNAFADGQEAKLQEINTSNLKEYAIIAPDELNNYQSWNFVGVVGERVIVSKIKV